MPAVEILAGKKILIVLCTLDLGGAERQALLLAKYLKRTCKADVAFAALFGGLGNQIVRVHAQKLGIPCLRVAMPDHKGSIPSFASLRQFVREVKFLKPDLLLPYTAFPNVICGAAWEAARVPMCIWNQRDEGRELLRESFGAMALDRTPRFISNSTAGRDCLIAHKVAAGKIHVVHNGVVPQKPSVARDDLRARLMLPQGAFVATMVANLHSYKDHATLISAWKKVNAEMSQPAHLVLAGRPDDTAAALEAQTKDLSLTDVVHFLGPVSDVASLLHASDMLVHSSLNEGLPNAILEAMSAGLPVVATDIPGARDALGEKYPFLVSPRDPETLAACVLALMRSPELAASTGDANCARAQSEFSPDHMCQQSAKLFAQALCSATSTR